MNILFTGAGGAYTKYILDKLDKTNLFNKIVVVDNNYESISNLNVNYKYKVPLGSSKSFIPKIIKILDKRKIKVVVSVVDEELIKFLKIKKKKKIIFTST